MEQLKTDTTSKRTNQTYFENRHAFIVGINDYKYVPTLQTAINDAQKLATLLEAQYDYKTHLCENPNGQILRGYIEKIGETVTERDCALFYFAGHGIATDSEKGIKGFIVPADAQINDDNTLISMSDLLDAFSQLKCKHFLVILDCCFAGAFRWAEKHRAIGRIKDKLFQQHYRYYSDNPSWQVLTSTSHTQKALDYLGGRETDDSGHSPFAKCLIDGLNGQADFNRDKIITLSALFAYLQTRFAGISQGIRNVQNVGLFPLAQHGNGEFMFIRTGFDPSELKDRDYENPYMGLQAYTDDKAHLFFGREKAKYDLLEKINNHNFTVIIGASGTGKSSLVKAGILPELRKKGLKIAQIRPNKDPMAELANWEEDFDVLVIDQFEEIVTQSDPTKAAEFAKILRGYISTGEKKIILTVRIDFEPQIDKTGIEAAWQSGRYLIPPFMPEELREVIITPAARVGRFIDSDRLVSEIVNEVVHYPGSLPLLSFTLSELFERCKNDPYRNIRYEDYQNLGGVTGSLQKSADRIAQNCTDAERLSLRNVMLRMVSIAGGETAGKRILLSDLVFENDDENKRVADVIEKLDNARLIVKNLDNNEEAYIEPTHDALVRSWGTLYEWIKTFQEENLLLLSKLNLAVLEYESKNQQETFLWDRNPNLKQAFELPNTEGVILNVLELAFLKKSHKKEKVEIEALKAERDEAIQQKEAAQKETRAANNSSLALRTLNNDQTLALRISEYNVTKHPTNDVVNSVFHDIISNENYHFYRQSIKSDHSVITTFSPNGETFLTAGLGHVANMWSLDGQLITTLEGHNEQRGTSIKSIAFSPDGRSILTGSSDKTAKIWVLDGKSITKPSVTFEGHNGGRSFADEDIGLKSVIFSPNGQTVLHINMDKTAKLWSIKGELMAVFEEQNEAISLIGFSPNSEMIVTVSSNKTAKLWSLDGKMLTIFEGHTDMITAIAFSPDGKFLLTGSSDKTAILWSLDGKILTILEGHKGNITSVAFSPNGQIILTNAGECKLWSLYGQILATLSHKRSISSFAFSPDSKRIVTGGYDFTAKIWSLGGHVEHVLENGSPITDVKFSPDGTKILTVDVKKVKLWRINQSKTLTNFSISTKPRLSPNREIILAGDGNIAKLWSLDGQVISTFEGHQEKISQVLFSPNGKTVLTSQENIAKLWSLDGQVISTFEGHQEKISSIEFSSTGEHILTNSTDKTARLWSLNGKNITTIPYKNPRIYFVFAEDGQSLLMEMSGGKVKKKWSLEGELLDTFDVIYDNDSFLFYPDGKTKLSIIEGGDKAVLYSMSGKILATFIGHQTMVNAAAFSQDDKILATGDMDGLVKIWTIDGKLIITLPEHQQGISFIVFTNDGKKIITSDGKTIRVSMTPAYFLEKRVYKFSMKELHNAGVQLEPNDLQTLWTEDEKLSEEELKLIEKSGNKVPE